MHCTSRNGADTAVFSSEVPPLGAQRDAFLAAILAQNMKKYAGAKRACPFAQAQRQRRCPQVDNDIQALQQDVAELEARLEAARKRAQPKKQVDADRLRRMLQACRMQAQQRVKVNVDVGFTPCASGAERLEYEPSVDAPAFRLMEQSVTDQYAQLAQVFTDAGLDEAKTDFYDARVVTGGKQGTFVRFTTAKVAPFELDTISGAMWSGAMKNSVLNMEANPAIEGGDDSIIYLKKQCTLKCETSGAPGIPVLLRGVCRRFVEADRIVLVWDGTGDWPKDYLRSHPSSVPIRERGYCVVQRFQRGTSKSSHAAPLSLFQTCVSMTPGMSADIKMDEPECLKMLADVVIPSYRKILDAREQLLENAILDEMIHSKMRGATSRI